MSNGADAETVHELLDGRLSVTLPDGYDLHSDGAEDGRAQFRIRGGRTALAERFSDHPYDDQFLDRFLYGDMKAVVTVSALQLVPTEGQVDWAKSEGGILVPSDASEADIHRRYCEAFASYFDGPITFATFESQTGIGRCVNVEGAFVAAFTRRVGNALVVVGAMDAVEVLIVEKKGPGRELLGMTAAQKWKVFRAAANADVAEQVLLSAEAR